MATDYELDLAAVYHALADYYDHPQEIQHWREQKRAAGRRAQQQQLDPEQYRRKETV